MVSKWVSRRTRSRTILTALECFDSAVMIVTVSLLDSFQRKLCSTLNTSGVVRISGPAAQPTRPRTIIFKPAITCVCIRRRARPSPRRNRHPRSHLRGRLPGRSGKTMKANASRPTLEPYQRYREWITLASVISIIIVVILGAFFLLR